MTDELSLQPQAQQNGSYAVPGMLTGGVLGAGAGYGVAHWTKLGYKTKAEYDKVIAMKDDEFKKQIENAGDNKGSWEKAQELAKKVNDAEKEYESKIEELMKSGSVSENISELADTEQAKKDYLAAKANYDKALETQKKKFAAKNTGNAVELKSANEMHAPASFTGTRKEFETKYTELLKEYNSAITKAKGETPYTTANNALESRKTLIEKLYDDAKSKAEKTSEPEKAFNVKKAKSSLWQKLSKPFTSGGGDTTIYEDINEVVKRKILPEPNELTAEQIKGLGDFVAETDVKKLPKAGKGFNKHTQELIKVEDGSKKLQGYVIVDKGVQVEALEKVKNEVRTEQKRLTEEYFAKAKQKYEIDKKIANFDANFKISTEQSKAAGGADLAKIKLEMAKYEADLAELEKIKSVERTNLSDSAKALLDEYDATKEPKEILNMVKARKAIADRYNKDLAKLKEQAARFIQEDSGVVELSEKLETVLQRDKGVRKARGKMRHAFPEFFSDGAKLTEDEIASRAEEAVKKEKEALTNAENKAKERLKELGKETEVTREKAIEKFGKSKEEFTKAARDDAKKEFEKLAEKLKINNKWVTAGIGAAALALAGLGIGAASKKSVPEEVIE